MKSFEVRARQAGRALVLDLSGSLGQEGAEALRQAVGEVTGSSVGLVLNFSEVHPISTAGLAGVLFVVRQVVRGGGEVAAYGLSDHYRKVFYVMGLTQFIRLCPDESTALQ